jgi:predicted RNA-binding protein YlxR (DUF448 family)
MLHVPLRRCGVCRQQLPKAQLTRWTVREGSLERDSSQTGPGRGYYSCSERCAEIINRKSKRSQNGRKDR